MAQKMKYLSDLTEIEHLEYLGKYYYKLHSILLRTKMVIEFSKD